MTRIILPKPLSVKQGILMDALTAPGLVEMWVACGTKFGKSFGASAALTKKAVTSYGALQRWVAPIYSQTKIGFKYCNKFLPKDELHVDNQSLMLKLKEIDSSIEFKSGKNPEDLEGEGTDGNVLDEVAKMQRQVYDSVKTTTTLTRGPIIGISTPRGKNWFYLKCMEARDRMEWEIKNGKPVTHLFITAPSTDNPLVSQQAVKDAMRSMPERLFRQYYLAEFVDDGSVFLGYKDCLYGQPLEFEGAMQRWVSPDYKLNPTSVVIGADWAKTTDWAVFTAFCTVTRRLVGFWRFHKTPYTEAIRRLVLFARGFKEVIVVRHDKTGLGQVIDDNLANTDLPYEGVTFSNPWKAQAVAALMTSCEQQIIGLPRWQHMIDEMESYEVKTNAIGTLTYSAPTGLHDDIVSSMLLSHEALLQYSDSGMDIKFVEPLKNPNGSDDIGTTAGIDAISPIERFYRDATEDNDD